MIKFKPMKQNVMAILFFTNTSCLVQIPQEAFLAALKIER
jgi:hypothetical protein